MEYVLYVNVLFWGCVCKHVYIYVQKSPTYWGSTYIRKVEESRVSGWQKVHPNIVQILPLLGRTWKNKVKVRTSVFYVQGQDLKNQTKIRMNIFIFFFSRRGGWRRITQEELVGR